MRARFVQGAVSRRAGASATTLAAHAPGVFMGLLPPCPLPKAVGNWMEGPADEDGTLADRDQTPAVTYGRAHPNAKFLSREGVCDGFAYSHYPPLHRYDTSTENSAAGIPHFLTDATRLKMCRAVTFKQRYARCSSNNSTFQNAEHPVFAVDFSQSAVREDAHGRGMTEVHICDNG